MREEYEDLEKVETDYYYDMTWGNRRAYLGKIDIFRCLLLSQSGLGLVLLDQSKTEAEPDPHNEGPVRRLADIFCNIGVYFVSIFFRKSITSIIAIFGPRKTA